MTAENSSSVMDLTDQPGLRTPLLFLFLGFYVVTVLGNLALITLIGLNSHLHAPMYFFPLNLSFIDLGVYDSIFFSFCFFVFSESYILSAMGYDHYVAICRPLLYPVIMSPQVCSLLLLKVCDNLINHYMCDIVPLLELSCNRSYIHSLLVFIGVTIGIGVPIGRSKAFTTCSSHRIVRSLFFGSGAFMYLKPPSILPLGQGKVSSVFYAQSIDLCDVKISLRKTLSSKIFS
uniref:G-protein coupled receptors family 1 profile domain-containing protein n=1 Tax=Cavia porcellus TaxID=10141 RepID=A0A286XYY9_CAVPO